MKLRPYQESGVADIYEAWNTHKCVLFQLATGGGKTVTLSHIVHDYQGYSCVVAHRQELVLQLSVALAREGVMHDIMAPAKVIKLCVREQVKELGQKFYKAGSKCTVGSVQTLRNKIKKIPEWFSAVGLWVIDEAHHCQKKNTWGQVVEMFPKAYGLGVTATPGRPEGRGLGSSNDGIFDVLVQGVSCAELMDMGYLTRYKIFAPETDIDLMEVEVSSSTGDYKKPQLTSAMEETTIVGDVVNSHMKYASGKKTIVFSVSVESGQRIAEQFRLSGITAVMLDGNSDDTYRQDQLQKFRDGHIEVLVNCELFGEGFDVPSVECVQFARPTASLNLHLQQFGRALRPMDGKPHAIIIDHVGNVMRHGLPDTPRVWTLDRVEKSARGKSKNEKPIKTCTNPQCCFVYDAYLKACPFCGHVAQPADRNEPKEVEGELAEMSEELIRKLTERKEFVDQPDVNIGAMVVKGGGTTEARFGAMASHRKRQGMQKNLRALINVWGAKHPSEMQSDRGLMERKFFHTFKVDLLTAQGLGRPEAAKLCLQILGELEC